MPDTTLEILRHYAERFRRAIEACDRSLLPISFQRFPYGSCGDASLLLGNYLTDQGLGEFEYVSGEGGSMAENPPSWTTHAWIQQGNTIIDITADQFPDINEAVFVAVSSPWHDSFTICHKHRADYRFYDENTRDRLGEAYRQIVAVARRDWRHDAP